MCLTVLARPIMHKIKFNENKVLLKYFPFKIIVIRNINEIPKNKNLSKTHKVQAANSFTKSKYV